MQSSKPNLITRDDDDWWTRNRLDRPFLEPAPSTIPQQFRGQTVKRAIQGDPILAIYGDDGQYLLAIERATGAIRFAMDFSAFLMPHDYLPQGEVTSKWRRNGRRSKGTCYSYRTLMQPTPLLQRDTTPISLQSTSVTVSCCGIRSPWSAIRKTSLLGATPSLAGTDLRLRTALPLHPEQSGRPRRAANTDPKNDRVVDRERGQALCTHLRHGFRLHLCGRLASARTAPPMQP